MFRWNQTVLASLLSVALLLQPGLLDPVQSDVVLVPRDTKDFVLPKQFQQRLGDYRKTWPRLTGLEYSGLHWKNRIVVFINKDPQIFGHNHQNYLAEHDDDSDSVNFQSYPPGTVLLKEAYQTGPGQSLIPANLNLMIKEKEGYDPTGGDWRYLQIRADGLVLLTGKARSKAVFKTCGECHLNIAERDYIFATKYRPNTPVYHADR